VTLAAREGGAAAAGDSAGPEDSDESLGVDIDSSSGQTSAQTAAVELVMAERDLLNEELTALASKLGVSADIGPLPAVEDEKGEVETEAGEEAAATSAPAAPQSAPASPAAAPASAEEEAPAGVGESNSSFSAPAADAPDAVAPAPEASGATSLFASFLGGGAAAEPEAASSFATTTGGDDVGGASLFAGLLGGGAAAAIPSTDGTADGLVASGFPSLGAGDEDSSAVAAVSASGEEEAEGGAAPQDDPAAAEAARVSELAQIALGVANVYAAVQEKNSVIEEAVSHEDYDTAGALTRCAAKTPRWR
jgi:hypothetical protein